MAEEHPHTEGSSAGMPAAEITLSLQAATTSASYKTAD